MQWILYRIKDKVNGLFKRRLLSLRKKKNGTNEIKINVFFRLNQMLVVEFNDLWIFSGNSLQVPQQRGSYCSVLLRLFVS